MPSKKKASSGIAAEASQSTLQDALTAAMAGSAADQLPAPQGQSVETLKQQGLKKHAMAIHVSGELSAVERRLANILLLNAFRDLLIDHKTHRIPASWLFVLLDWNKSEDTASLKEALRKIRATGVELDLLGDTTKKWSTMGLISFGSIENGICEYRYEPELARELYHPASYAVIYLDVQNRFKSSYAFNLWENCLRFKDTGAARDLPGSTGFIEVATWRKLLGATAKTYDVYKRFSNKILSPAIKKVNEVSDIHITPEYQKSASREVVAIKFRIEPNKNNPSAVGQIGQDSALQQVMSRLETHGIRQHLFQTMGVKLSVDEISSLIDYAEFDKKVNDKSAWLLYMLKTNKPLSPGQKKAIEKLNSKQRGLFATSAQQEKEAEESARQDAARAWWKSLSEEQRDQLALEFTETDKGRKYAGSYDREKQSFKDIEPYGIFRAFILSAYDRTNRPDSV